MDTKIGQTFKNYKELCDYLDEPIKTGKSKQLQLLDWKRNFEYKQEGYKFIITDVFDTPKKKKQRTGNNIKNIKVMIEYLQCIGIEEKWTSMTDWYCEELKLLNKNICNLFYGKESEIKTFCYQMEISDRVLFRKYVTYAKSELKRIFIRSLKYLEKKNLTEYADGYMFIYRMGKRSTGYVRTEMINDVLMEYETFVCNEMNEEYELSNKLIGRQNLLKIYNKKELYTEFNERVLSMLMEDQDALDILNKCASDQNENYLEGSNSVCKERALFSYHRVISIIYINELEGDCGALRIELCNLLRKKVRNRLWKEHYTSKYTGRVIYPYDDMEKIPDILKIEKLLFQAFDFEYNDGSYCDVLKYDLWEEVRDYGDEMMEISFDGDEWIEDEVLPF